MKKIIYLLFAASLLIVGCTRFAEDGPVSYDSVAAPQINQMHPNADVERTDADSSFYFKVIPAQGTNFYAYVVVQGPAKPLDPETVASLGYKSVAVTCNKVFWDSYTQEYVEQEVPIQDNINANVETGKDTVVFVDGLLPNTKYTIYAVATNNQGVVSELSTLTVRTKDSEAPQIVVEECALIDGSDSVMNVVFNEPVVLGDAPAIKAYYYAKNTQAEGQPIPGGEIDPSYARYAFNFLEPVASLDVPVENIALGEDGRSIDVTLPRFIPGAYVALWFGEGVVYDKEDTPHPSQEHYDVELVEAWDAGWSEPVWSDVEVEPWWDAVFCHLESTTFDLLPGYNRSDELRDTLALSDSLFYHSPEKLTGICFIADSLDLQYAGNKLVFAGSDYVKATASVVEYGMVVVEKSYLVQNWGTSHIELPTGTVNMATLDLEPEDFPESKYPLWSALGFTVPEGAYEDIWGNWNNALCTMGKDEDGTAYYGNFYRYDISEIEGWWDYAGFAPATAAGQGCLAGLAFHINANVDGMPAFLDFVVDSVAVKMYAASDSSGIGSTEKVVDMYNPIPCIIDEHLTIKFGLGAAVTICDSVEVDWNAAVFGDVTDASKLRFVYKIKGADSGVSFTADYDNKALIGESAPCLTLEASGRIYDSGAAYLDDWSASFAFSGDEDALPAYVLRPEEDEVELGL